MRLRTILSLATAGVLLATAAPAAANYPHVVAAGETLTSVASADGLTVGQLAAANGISPFTQIVAGTTLMIPPQSAASGVPTYVSSSGTDGDGDNDGDSAASATSAAPSASSAGGGSYVVQPGDTLSAIASRAGVSVASLASANGLDPNAVLLAGTTLSLSGSAASTSTASTTSTVSTSSSGSSGGSYVVAPGDTLSAIAARAGVTIASLAAANGLDPNGVLVSGTVLHLSGSAGSSSPASAVSSQPIGAAAQGTAGGPPYPTPETVSSSEVGTIASANGVPPAFADAIGYQESGFNNDLVSSAGAVGVMQILPGTWDWINRTMTAGTALNPSSAADNVRAGSLMLHSLLAATGGSTALAAAGYYQGLASVQQNGMYSDTQQYVNNVEALMGRFGGG